MNYLKITKNFTPRVDTLEKYLREISKIPLLTLEEEVELSKHIREGDTTALDRLIKSNLRFVVSVAKQYMYSTQIPIMDLINEGNIGLIKAAQKFDETKGFKFISYAVW